ncbi:hypothetical protein X798_05568 [Onchocerca flexuosa]|uniref:Uncharacterized protein n=1 Tax=Onchocerca flexuosa TaxID=387005 RepID=A0A238BPY1_9BILA|nr:hypothetical protein X798_05568 [Onchocerca flexuosa]
MEVTTRVASLDRHMMNQAIREVAENSFKDWRSKFPLPIAIKLESIQNEILLIIDTLLWFNRLKSECVYFLKIFLLYFYRKGGYQNLTERITRLKVAPRETLETETNAVITVTTTPSEIALIK